jgi:hypothetical protein
MLTGALLISQYSFASAEILSDQALRSLFENGAKYVGKSKNLNGVFHNEYFFYTGGRFQGAATKESNEVTYIAEGTWKIDGINVCVELPEKYIRQGWENWCDAVRHDGDEYRLGSGTITPNSAE